MMSSMSYHNTLNHFDSIKWKKRLSNLSHKLQRSNKNHWNASSATVLAAATEKYIRHEDTICSEDLTASQFANLTGINRKSQSLQSLVLDDDSDDDDEDEPQEYDDVDIEHSKPVMRIWDSHFWQDNRVPQSKQLESSSNNNKKPTSILISSQPLGRQLSEPGGKRIPSMIQKGRFKIVWGADDDNEPVAAPESHCLEWKRKRASTS
ncbi:hypothetical protein K501DRAFT_243455 [Backusella circina FSU 941]|nr:hypothetical protein K501DRAFT_243455 [Backusella circina FSU 941]